MGFLFVISCNQIIPNSYIHQDQAPQYGLQPDHGDKTPYQAINDICVKTFFKALSAGIVTELQTGLGDQAIDDLFLLNSHLFALNKKHVKCGDA